MIKRINSFFSVSKKVKRDTTQQTDPGGGGQAEHEDEGRQDIQEPDQVGGNPSQDLSKGMGLLCLMALQLEVEEKSIAIGHHSQAEPNDEGGDPKRVRGNGTSLFEDTPGGGGGEASEEEEKDRTLQSPVEPVDSGGQTAEDEEGLDSQEQHDVGGDQKLVRKFNVR